MINEFVNLVDEWDLEDLIDFTKAKIREYWETLSTEKIEQEYVLSFGVEDYPETFPDGYHEP